MDFKKGLKILFYPLILFIFLIVLIDCAMVANSSNIILVILYVGLIGITGMCLIGTLSKRFYKISWLLFFVFTIITICFANISTFRNARKIDMCFDLGGVWQDTKSICECECSDESVGIMDMDTLKCMRNGYICHDN